MTGRVLEMRDYVYGLHFGPQKWPAYISMRPAERQYLYCSETVTHIPDIKQTIYKWWQAKAEPSNSPNIADGCGQAMVPSRVARVPPAPLHEVLESNREWLGHEERELADIVADGVEDVPLMEQHTQGEGDVKL